MQSTSDTTGRAQNPATNPGAWADIHKSEAPVPSCNQFLPQDAEFDSGVSRKTPQGPLTITIYEADSRPLILAELDGEVILLAELTRLPGAKAVKRTLQRNYEQAESENGVAVREKALAGLKAVQEIN